MMGSSNSTVEEKTASSRLPLSKCPSPASIELEHEVGDEFNDEENERLRKEKIESTDASKRDSASPASQLCEEEKPITVANHVDVKFQTPQRKSAQSGNGNEQDCTYITSFFIGLSFRRGLARADVSHTIQVSTKFERINLMNTDKYSFPGIFRES